jgi:hypothetical protein
LPPGHEKFFFYSLPSYIEALVLVLVAKEGERERLDLMLSHRTNRFGVNVLIFYLPKKSIKLAIFTQNTPILWPKMLITLFFEEKRQFFVAQKKRKSLKIVGIGLRMDKYGFIITVGKKLK